MTGSATESVRQRVIGLAARMDDAGAVQDLDALKTDLAAAYKSIEREVEELGVLRDEVLALIERWKGLRSGQASHSPRFAPERPVVHEDHLGASTFIEKGWSKLSLGDHEGAEAALRKAVELAPNDPQSQALLGWALMLEEKYDEALMVFQQVLIREPQNALARINVGYICLKKGIFGEAIEHLSRAIRLDNDKKATLYAHFYLGLVYLQRDMFEDAQTFFQKTIALGPNLIEAYFELGRAFWFNGQREEAIEAWTNGRETNKFNPWGKRCASVLETVAAGGEP